MGLQSKEKARGAGLEPPPLLPSLFPACSSAVSVLSALLTQGTEEPLPGRGLKGFSPAKCLCPDHAH